MHGIGFLMIVSSMMAACFVFARGFRSRGLNGWAAYSTATWVAIPSLIALT